MMHTTIFTMYVGTTKLTAINLKTESFDNMFFIHFNKQKAGVLGWPWKLLQSPYSKVCLTSSLPLRPNECIFLAFNAPSQFFLRESCKAAAWWGHCTSVIHASMNPLFWCRKFYVACLTLSINQRIEPIFSLLLCYCHWNSVDITLQYNLNKICEWDIFCTHTEQGFRLLTNFSYA